MYERFIYSSPHPQNILVMRLIYMFHPLPTFNAFLVLTPKYGTIFRSLFRVEECIYTYMYINLLEDIL